MPASFFSILLLCFLISHLRASPLVDLKKVIRSNPHGGLRGLSPVARWNDELSAIDRFARAEPRIVLSRALQVRTSHASPGGLYYDRTSLDDTDKCLEILAAPLNIVNTVVSKFLGPILFGLTGVSLPLQSSLKYIMAKTAFDMSAEYLAFAYCKLSSTNQEKNVPALPGTAPPSNNPATTVDLMPSGGFTAKHTYCIVGQESKCTTKPGPATTCAQVAVKVTTINFLQWVLLHNGLPIVASMWDAFLDDLTELHGVVINVLNNPILGICKAVGSAIGMFIARVRE
ncbi:MAG: hypothetical protein M1835_007877 [Candelina submexicana]|nr:MAG: hypothetical protein M1835_007877 [Candelina submexicana]